MRAVARRCGFSELEAPSVESQELFKVKSGDAIVDELWAFQDKGGRDVALAAETTPSLARIFAERAKAEPLPVKWFTVAKLWRYEEPQAGRTREFTQFNLDILGPTGVEADADVLGTTALLLDEVGAAGLYAFRINDRGVAEALGAKFGATQDPARFFRAVDRYKKLKPAEFLEELLAAGLSDDQAEGFRDWLAGSANGTPIAQAGPWLDGIEKLGLSESGKAGVARLRRLAELLVAAGLSDRCWLDPTIVRGFAYYTSTVFEAFDRTADARSLFGGGRYDKLVELFGGPPTAACGLAIGDQTLELLLKAHDRWPEGEPALDTFVIAVTPGEVAEAAAWVHRLRRAGVSADADLMGRSLSKQLKEAARRRARRALLLGPKELARGVVVERDLTTGSQRELAPDAVLPPA